MRNRNHVVLLIGGPSASGKNTLIEQICKEDINIGYYKRNSAFFDCAKVKNISKEQVYEKISSSEANERFIEECCKYDVLVSDVHYGVQLNRDRAFAIGQKGDDIEEIYVPTISEELLLLFKVNKIKVIAVLLWADAQILMKRAKERADRTGKAIRASSLDDISKEIEAEQYYWNKLKGNSRIRCICYDTEKSNYKEIVSDLREWL